MIRNPVIQRCLSSTKFKFLVVGGVGFVVDGGLLLSLISLGGGYYSSRLISFPAAVLVTWYLNRIWSFDSASKSFPERQLAKYFTVQIVGSLVNYVGYSVFLVLFDKSLWSAFFGFAIGSILGLFVNYTGAKLIVFTKDEVSANEG